MPEKYYSYLLRLWNTGTKEHPIWRVMLEDPHTRQVMGFDGLDAFFTHLQNLAVESADPDDQDHIAGNS